MLMELRKFSDESFVNQWLSEVRWPGGNMICPRCQSERTSDSTHLTMPFRCGDCRKFFSLKFGTTMQSSRVPLHKWTTAVVHDLKNSTGIISADLSQKIGVNRDCARLMLRHIGNALVAKSPTVEFKTGKLFRFDEILYDGQEFKILESGKVSKNSIDSAKFLVICITEFNSNKIWVEVVQNSQLSKISEIVEKILPTGAYIFTGYKKYYEDINRKKYKIRNKTEFEEHVSAQAKELGIKNTDKTALAGSQLTDGLAAVYHKLTLKELNFYVKSFAGRWNIQKYDLERQVRLVFSVILNNETAFTQASAKKIG